MAETTDVLERLVIFPFLIAALQILRLFKKCYLVVKSILFQSNTPIVVRTPEERFKGLEALGYTFKPNYVELPIGGGKTLPRVHYVDEGPRDAKETILCLHGEPSWSFLYRHMIRLFVKAGHRVIVPDFIGFGKSDKFTFPEAYSHELHTMTLRLLLDHLRVRNLTLVCQDWGGLTGLPVVKDSPHFFSRLVIMNTGLPVGHRFSPALFKKATPFMLWRSIVQFRGNSLCIYSVFKRSLNNPTPAVLNAYNAPFPSSEFKAGAVKWPLLVPLSKTPVAADMQETRDFLKQKWKKPVLVMFSDGDPVTKGQDRLFLELCPHAVTKTIHGAQHFLQEDKGEELASHILAFVGGKL